MERQKTTFHLLLHIRFHDLVRWTVFIGAMLKTGFGKKVHIQGFVNGTRGHLIEIIFSDRTMDIQVRIPTSSLYIVRVEKGLTASSMSPI